MEFANLEKAIERITEDQDYCKEIMTNVDKLKKDYNLSEEDMLAMQTYNPQMQTFTPRPTAFCCCCLQCDN